MHKEIISLVAARVSNYIARGQGREKTYVSLYTTSYLLNVFNEHTLFILRKNRTICIDCTLQRYIKREIPGQINRSNIQGNRNLAIIVY